MKKLFVIAAALGFAACSGNADKYVVTGSSDSLADGDKVILSYRDTSGVNISDTAVVTNGKFVFKGTAAKPVFAILSYDGSDEQSFILENGKIDIVIKENMMESLSGTENNRLLNEFNATEAVRNMANLMKKFTEGTMTAEDSLQIEPVQNAYMDAYKEFVLANPASFVGTELFKNIYYMLSTEEVDRFFAGVAEETVNGDEILVKIKEVNDVKKNTAEGCKFVDMKMQTPEGKEISLSDIAGKGKVVLVDFWASWCGPCRAEMPNLVKAYKEFSGKNFEIVGVSLDSSADAWKAGIKNLGITWPQMSDLKGWQSEAAKLYGVNSIPHVLIIDGEGTIISRGLHGEELYAKLAEILK